MKYKKFCKKHILYHNDKICILCDAFKAHNKEMNKKKELLN